MFKTCHQPVDLATCKLHLRARTRTHKHTHPPDEIYSYKNIMRTSTFKKNNVPQLGVSELWLVVFHAATSPQAFQCPRTHSGTSATPFTAQRFLPAPRVPSRPLCEEDLNQGKPKQCTMDPPLPPMIQLWREGNMGEEAEHRERGEKKAGGVKDVQAFSLVKRGGAC